MLNSYNLDKEMLNAVKTRDKAKQVTIFNKYVENSLNNNPVVKLCAQYKRGT